MAETAGEVVVVTGGIEVVTYVVLTFTVVWEVVLVLPTAAPPQLEVINPMEINAI